MGLQESSVSPFSPQAQEPCILTSAAGINPAGARWFQPAGAPSVSPSRPRNSFTPVSSRGRAMVSPSWGPLRFTRARPRWFHPIRAHQRARDGFTQLGPPPFHLRGSATVSPSSGPHWFYLIPARARFTYTVGRYRARFTNTVSPQRPQPPTSISPLQWARSFHPFCGLGPGPHSLTVVQRLLQLSQASPKPSVSSRQLATRTLRFTSTVGQTLQAPFAGFSEPARSQSLRFTSPAGQAPSLLALENFVSLELGLQEASVSPHVGSRKYRVTP